MLFLPLQMELYHCTDTLVKKLLTIQNILMIIPQYQNIKYYNLNPNGIEKIQT